MILCVFFAWLISARSSVILTERLATPNETLDSSCRKLTHVLTVGLEAVLTAEEGPLDAEPDASDSENGAVVA